MFQKQQFAHKKLGEKETYSTYKDILKKKKKQNIIKTIFVVACIIGIGYLGKYLILWASFVMTEIGKGTAKIVSNSLWKDMKTDEYGNVNILLLGYGGENHAGGYLADSIILTSRNQKKWAVTMLSLPRDLYIQNTGESMAGRINELFTRAVGRKHEFETGANVMIKEVEEITSVKADYYALIDFQGFQKVIDILGGIDIFVEKPILDTTYPGPNNTYMTFSVHSGRNTFDGKSALMYARSRHSTSDFSRSLRQQQIIKAILEKIKKNGTSVPKLKALYKEYTAMVHTNVSLDEMLGLMKYLDKQPQIISFGYTSECSHLARKYSNPACFLYAPDRSLYGGASIIIPFGAKPGQVSFYEYMRNFGFFVTHSQDFLLEKTSILIQNAIDKKYAKSIKMKNNPYATQMAVKLKKFWFAITGVQNAPATGQETIVYIVGTGKTTDTINTLRSFITIDRVEQYSWTTLTGVDLLLKMGNNYLNTLQGKPFNYYR